jgi:hypothetical protein
MYKFLNEMNEFIVKTEKEAKSLVSKVTPTKVEELSKARKKIEDHFREILKSTNNFKSLSVDLTDLVNFTSKYCCRIILLHPNNGDKEKPIAYMEYGVNYVAIFKENVGTRYNSHVYLYEFEEKHIYFIIKNWEEINTRIENTINKLMNERIENVQKEVAYNKEIIESLSNFNN